MNIRVRNELPAEALRNYRRAKDHLPFKGGGMKLLTLSS